MATGGNAEYVRTYGGVVQKLLLDLAPSESQMTGII
jgi:hypothetical protein